MSEKRLKIRNALNVADDLSRALYSLKDTPMPPKGLHALGDMVLSLGDLREALNFAYGRVCHEEDAKPQETPTTDGLAVHVEE